MLHFLLKINDKRLFHHSCASSIFLSPSLVNTMDIYVHVSVYCQVGDKLKNLILTVQISAELF